MGIESVREISHIDVAVGFESNTFGFHDAYATVYNSFVKFKVRYAEAEQAADIFKAFEHGDVVAAMIQLVGGGKSCRTRPDDGNALAFARIGTRHNISFAERRLGNCAFVFAYGHRRVHCQFEHTTLLAQCRADTSGKFGKIVGGGKYFVSLSPFALVERILEFGRAIAQRACPVAEGHAAIHAARRLLTALRCVKGLFYFAEIGNAVVYGTIAGFLARYGEECFRVSHNVIFVSK